MRSRFNPNRNKVIDDKAYTHQVIIPVFIPNEKGYYRDAIAILKLCLESLFRTSHERTFFSLINNGSCAKVKEYLDELKRNKSIQEVIHTENIGKLNSIIKGLGGHNFPLVTISDYDVLFLENWQSATVTLFNEVPLAGTVGIIPQPLGYQNNCENIISRYLFSKIIRFVETEDPEAMEYFHISLGQKKFSKTKFQHTLGLFRKDEVLAIVGFGHAVATYRNSLFKGNMDYFSNYRMGGNSEEFLDTLSVNSGYYGLSTLGNYARHMGNTLEDWMNKTLHSIGESSKVPDLLPEVKPKWSDKIGISYRRAFIKWVFKRQKLRYLFSKYKGLPVEALEYF